MRAALITTLFDGPGSSRSPRECPSRWLPLLEVLIDVEYAGVVFPDVLYTRGEYQVRPELPFIPGWEVSGVVRADAGGFRAGERVAALPMIRWARRGGRRGRSDDLSATRRCRLRYCRSGPVELSDDAVGTPTSRSAWSPVRRCWCMGLPGASDWRLISLAWQRTARG